MSKVRSNSPPQAIQIDPSKSPNQNELVEQNLGLAESLANKFSWRGIDNDDLKQVAYLALVKAARSYEPDRQVPFTAYATPTIVGELKRYFRDSGWMVRPPRWVQNLQLEIRNVLSEYPQGEAVLSDQQIAQLLGIGVDQVTQARAAYGCFSPLSIERMSDKSQRRIGEKLVAATYQYDLVDFLDCLATACQGLDGSERQLIRMRFVEEQTQQEIAKELGISQVQVSRHLRRVIIKLRAAVGGNGENEDGSLLK